MISCRLIVSIVLYAAVVFAEEGLQEVAGPGKLKKTGVAGLGRVGTDALYALIIPGSLFIIMILIDRGFSKTKIDFSRIISSNPNQSLQFDTQSNRIDQLMSYLNVTQKHRARYSNGHHGDSDENLTPLLSMSPLLSPAGSRSISRQGSRPNTPPGESSATRLGHSRTTVTSQHSSKSASRASSRPMSPNRKVNPIEKKRLMRHSRTDREEREIEMDEHFTPPSGTRSPALPTRSPSKKKIENIDI